MGCASFLFFDLPSMTVMAIHRAFLGATGREVRPWNIWAYRGLGLLLLGVVVIVVATVAAGG
ncbi:hypothetical protein [Cryptosporangium phraense]|uniref:Uncharacterized protein n=1 Tax=Cryptosporangium phraense TaxID=2593070 RepID=A0A545ANK9_9ACTN|nr:hypothetical protein [Cryptosporangium phraense]TQS42934.1 hypothetical protein FL583_21040 [Cryptosporangium phraense]